MIMISKLLLKTGSTANHGASSPGSSNGEKRFVYDVRLNPEYEELFYPWLTHQVFFAIHSPFVPINPFKDGRAMKPGYIHNINIRVASITAEVSAYSEDVDLAGDVICALIRPKGVLWYLDWSSEKASPVLEHPFCQTTSEQASMCEWSSYPAGREMGLPRNYCRRVESAALSRMSTYISELMFPITGTNGPRPNHEKHAHTIMLPPPNLTVDTMQSLKKRSLGIRQAHASPSDSQTV
ncbi:uncharacterized protein TNCV_3487361 [Trichonephila clavipes]|nr:uncharacterized protein TNCV_3487361 [Trichonephila clavipes]